MNTTKSFDDFPKTYREFIYMDFKMRLFGMFLAFISSGIVVFFMYIFGNFSKPIDYLSILNDASTGIVFYENYNTKTKEYQTSYYMNNFQLVVDNNAEVKIYPISEKDLKRMKLILKRCDLEEFTSSIKYQKYYVCLKTQENIYPLEQKWNIIDVKTFIHNLVDKYSKV